MEVRILRHNYLPSLYRQSTEKLPSTKLRREMSATLTKVLSEESMPSEHARQQFRDCMENLFQFTSKKNPFGIECTEHPIYAGDVTPWAPYDKTIPCYLFPMSLGKLTAEFLEPGYFIIPLPPPPKNPKSVKVNQLDIKSDDGEHVSPKKMYKALMTVLDMGIHKLKRWLSKPKEKSKSTITASLEEEGAILVPTARLLLKNQTLCLLMRMPDGSEVELVPTISASKNGPFFVAKPFENDEHTNSDMLWRVNFSTNQEHIMKAITSGDKKQRINAAKVLMYACKREWKLKHVTEYQIVNIMMHEIDFQIDHSPRWQRFTIDECLHLLLLRMLEFTRSKFLPHFFEQDLNLWSHLTERQFAFMRGLLEQLTLDDEELMRFVRRIRANPIPF